MQGPFSFAACTPFEVNRSNLNALDHPWRRARGFLPFAFGKSASKKSIDQFASLGYQARDDPIGVRYKLAAQSHDVGSAKRLGSVGGLS
jgi:hypothetical protein